MKAEALARSQSVEEALRVAKGALDVDANDPFALYAMAHAYYVKGDGAQARQLVDKAIEAKRGEAAHLLAGLMDYQVIFGS